MVPKILSILLPIRTDVLLGKSPGSGSLDQGCPEPLLGEPARFSVLHGRWESRMTHLWPPRAGFGPPAVYLYDQNLEGR